MKSRDWDALKSSPEYGLWRANVYARDKWRCRICGKREGRIEAHHIYPLRSHFEFRFRVGNGITLCVRHHRLIRGKELLVAKLLKEIIKNGVNSGKLRKDNPEPSREGNFSEGVTTRNRGYRIEQFVKKQVKCYGCGKKVMRHYFRVKEGKKYFCSFGCRGKKKWMIAWNKRKPEKRICTFCRKIIIPTPSQIHRKKKFCNNTCQVRWAWQNGKTMPKLERWARNYKQCLKCDTKEKKHFGQGLCMTCYNIQYNAGNIPKKTLPERGDIV